MFVSLPPALDRYFEDHPGDDQQPLPLFDALEGTGLAEQEQRQGREETKAEEGGEGGRSPPLQKLNKFEKYLAQKLPQLIKSEKAVKVPQ